MTSGLSRVYDLSLQMVVHERFNHIIHFTFEISSPMTRHSKGYEISDSFYINFHLLTENNILVLSWLTARSSGMTPVCFKTLTLSPKLEKNKSIKCG